MAYTATNWIDFVDPPIDAVNLNNIETGLDDVHNQATLIQATVIRIQESGGPTTLVMAAVADGEYLKRNGATIDGGTPAGGAGLYSDYIHIRDEKASGTAGGGFTLGAWRTRDLNVELDDTGGDAALAGNQITLEAGTYRCFISCPAYQVDSHQSRLYNITDASIELIGTTERAPPIDATASRSLIVGRFTLVTQKVLEVQHRSALTKAVDGFGEPAGFGVIEVYTEVELQKEV